MKILFVCESARKNESGGRVVRYLNKILKTGNHQVKLIVLNPDSESDPFYQENDVEFLGVRRNILTRFFNIFLTSRESIRFREILREFSPDVIHFASFDNGKPPRFVAEANASGATVVLQPWTMHFYCEQGFGFRDGEKCNLCVSGNYLNALTKRCTNYKGIPALLKRKLMHKRALKADVFLSSNIDLDQILLQYGVPQNRIIRFTVPFDYTSLLPPQMKEQNYSVFYGQANAHKGLNVLIELFKMLPNQKLKVYPLALAPDTFKSENVEVINNITWSNELPVAIASAKMVLIPSLWSTSTEYSMCEALLFKKPVIVFNTGVHKHIFKHGINAMVVEPNDVQGYAKAIIELDENDKLRSVIGENGYATLVEVNSIDNLYPALISAYQKHSGNHERKESIS